ncbi:hypothetical protein BBO99_00005221 [Phytophthora kernoviae]|uniref:Elicitin-like protein n=2 Tax=Phytophthora kernoviae TaxID=325452 RepID=A0A3R7JTQ0_9STRA|nr:hypothetical protein G195_006909 [Phytophthora kernoviae 00238/432]KAG2524781.1 hypothetical protein JM18_005229 [Phytophthora kernoviae]KAG2524952.1 hypothetical protein JM16_004596 [Phytophthora kernoviae]RLM96055.1 hypothetical protein BBI17_001695 [Phytophthora kernoviae]RLN79516.1 hypothetical protein BBO99_00005221 [Phytophthora kernoviae]
MQRLLLISLVVLLYNADAVGAAACTDAEDQVITDAYTTAASTSACAEHSSVSDLLITIMPPCSATECIAVVEQLAESIPNCTIGSSSSNRKVSLLQSLEICATPAPTPASTASTTNCSISETNETFNLFLETSEGEACNSSATLQMYYITFDTPCNSSCALALHDLGDALPNCYFERDENNKKEYLAKQFEFCEQLDDDLNISISIRADYILANPSSLVTNCTDEEIQKTLDFYLTVATNETCVNDSSICSHDIHVNTDCSSDCGELIQDLYYDLPKCYYDHIDYRSYTLNSHAQCDWIVNPDNIDATFHYLDIITINQTLSDKNLTTRHNNLSVSSMMKFSTLFPILAFVAVTIRADDCTSDDLALIQRAYANAEDNGSTVCPDAMTDPNYCPTECQNYLMNLLYELPDCSSNGINLKEGLQTAYEYCQMLSDGAAISSESSGVFSDTSSSSVVMTSSSSSTMESTSSTDSTNSTDAATDGSTSDTSDKATASTPAPDAGKSSGSSGATTAVAFTTAVLATTAFVFAAVL